VGAAVRDTGRQYSSGAPAAWPFHGVSPGHVRHRHPL